MTGTAAVRPLDDVSARELWAALAAEGRVSRWIEAEGIARRLDVPAAQVSRSLLALRLAAMAARGLLEVVPAPARWRLTVPGYAAAGIAAGRRLTDPEMWHLIASCCPEKILDLEALAGRLGVDRSLVERWCVRQERARRVRLADPVTKTAGNGEWRLTDLGAAAAEAAR